MFMVGRNVEVKVEKGRLLIVCELEGVGKAVSRSAKTISLATTGGHVRIPNSNLHLRLNLYSKQPGLLERIGT